MTVQPIRTSPRTASSNPKSVLRLSAPTIPTGSPKTQDSMVAITAICAVIGPRLEITSLSGAVSPKRIAKISLRDISEPAQILLV